MLFDNGEEKPTWQPIIHDLVGLNIDEIMNDIITNARDETAENSTDHAPRNFQSSGSLISDLSDTVCSARNDVTAPPAILLNDGTRPPSVVYRHDWGSFDQAMSIYSTYSAVPTEIASRNNNEGDPINSDREASNANMISSPTLQSLQLNLNPAARRTSHTRESGMWEKTRRPSHTSTLTKMIVSALKRVVVPAYGDGKPSIHENVAKDNYSKSAVGKSRWCFSLVPNRSAKTVTEVEGITISSIELDVLTDCCTCLEEMKAVKLDIINENEIEMAYEGDGENENECKLIDDEKNISLQNSEQLKLNPGPSASDTNLKPLEKQLKVLTEDDSLPPAETNFQVKKCERFENGVDHYDGHTNLELHDEKSEDMRDVESNVSGLSGATEELNVTDASDSSLALIESAYSPLKTVNGGLVGPSFACSSPTIIGEEKEIETHSIVSNQNFHFQECQNVEIPLENIDIVLTCPLSSVEATNEKPNHCNVTSGLVEKNQEFENSNRGGGNEIEAFVNTLGVNVICYGINGATLPCKSILPSYHLRRGECGRDSDTFAEECFGLSKNNSRINKKSILERIDVMIQQETSV